MTPLPLYFAVKAVTYWALFMLARQACTEKPSASIAALAAGLRMMLGILGVLVGLYAVSATGPGGWVFFFLFRYLLWLFVLATFYGKAGAWILALAGLGTGLNAGLDFFLLGSSLAHARWCC